MKLLSRWFVVGAAPAPSRQCHGAEVETLRFGLTCSSAQE